MTSRLILGVCVALVAWLTAGAMAVRSASRIWLRHWAEQRLHGADVITMYLDRPHKLLAAANMGVAITLVAAGMILGWRSAEEQDIAVLGLFGFAAVVVVFGQLIPRAIARRWPSILIPITMPVLRLANSLTAPMQLRRNQRVALTTTGTHVAMEQLLREGELEGVGKRDEIAIISGVMHFGERRVKDVMTHRADIFALSSMASPAAVARQVAESKFSRAPVYQGDLDHIVGMYHAFDVIKEGHGSLPKLRPVTTTPADARCNDLLFRMLRQRVHLAVVQDGAGKTIGIATLENLLEELVGDIHDEHDA